MCIQRPHEFISSEANSKQREDAKGGRRIAREVSVDGQKFLLTHQLRSEGQRRAPRKTGGRCRATTERLLCDPTGVPPPPHVIERVIARTSILTIPLPLDLPSPTFAKPWRCQIQRTRYHHQKKKTRGESALPRSQSEVAPHSNDTFPRLSGCLLCVCDLRKVSLGRPRTPPK